MKKSIGVAALLVSIAASVSVAQNTEPKAPAPFERLQKTFERFDVLYGEAEQMLRDGIKLGAAAPVRDTSAEQALIDKDKIALTTLDAELDATKKANQCVDAFTVEKMVAGYKKDWVMSDLPKLNVTDIFSRFSEYKAARAIEGGDKALCGGSAFFNEPIKFVVIKDPKDPNTISKSCEVLYAAAIRTKSILTHDAALCAKAFAAEDEVKPENRPKICEILLTMSDRPNAAAAKVAAILSPTTSAMSQARLESNIKEMTGSVDEGACAKLHPGESTGSEFCVAASRFKKARDAGKPSLCGTSGICLALMGGHDGGDSYGKLIGKAFCGRSALSASELPARLQQRNLLQSKLQRDSEALAAKLRAPVADVDPKSSPEKKIQDAYAAKLKELRWLVDESMKFMQSFEPKSDPNFEDWYDKVMALNDRFNELSQRGSPAVKSRPRAAKKPKVAPPAGNPKGT